MKFRSKPGKFGTLYLYEVRFRDRTDPDNPFDRGRYWAYDADHAVDRFYESLIADDGEFFTVLSVSRVKERAL